MQRFPDTHAILVVTSKDALRHLLRLPDLQTAIA
jgi:hypothetical protein